MRVCLAHGVVAVILTSVAALGAQTGTPTVGPTGPLAVRRVAVLDVRAGRIVPDQTVVIDDGRIREVGPAATVRVPPGARILDGGGKYLIPGLWDMHAHFSKKTAPAIDMPLYVAYGVTGVREMDGFMDCSGPADGTTPRQEDDACLTHKREWQRRIEAGDLLGPRMLALGSFLVNGPPPPTRPRREPAFLNAETADDGRRLARYVRDQGADFTKIYTNVRREVYFALLDESRRIGLTAAGHRPVAVTLTELSEAGQRSVEHAHAQDFLFPCWPGSAEFGGDVRRAPPLSAALIQKVLTEFDSALCDQIFRTFVKNATSWVPTLVTEDADARAEDLLTDPRSRFVPATRWANWVTQGKRAVARPADVRAVLYRRLREIVGQAHRAGVRLMVGTDAGAPLVFKGSGVHDEMVELSHAGLAAADVLRAATINAADFLGKTSDFGSVEKGKVADLVILTANPVADIGNIRHVDAIILGGRHFDRAALSGMLETVAEAVRREAK